MTTSRDFARGVNPDHPAAFNPRPRVDDRFPFGCGDFVREKEGRHVGRVSAVIFDSVVVRWVDTGWRSDFTADQIEIVPKEER